MAKILLVEDDIILAKQIEDLLTQERHNVEVCVDGLDASERLSCFKYDIVVLDWGLPGFTGVEIVRKFRARGGLTPVLILTGKGRVEEKEQGLEAGADDYLTKPFEIRELVARLKALLRRPTGFVGSSLEAGNLVVNLDRHSATCKNKEIALQPKEFDLLVFLLKRKGAVVKTQDLLEHVWSSDSDVTSETIYTYIRALRKKIEEAGGDPGIIHTVRGIGYIVRDIPAAR